MGLQKSNCCTMAKRVKKEYALAMVKQKNGRSIPIKKRTKYCPECGQFMYIEKHKQGGTYPFKKSKTKWKCSDSLCNHSELEEGLIDKNIRHGMYDRSIGILPLTNFL